MSSGKIENLLKIIDSISDWTGKVFSYIVVPLTVLIVFEVITRRFFDAPTIWTFEMSNFLFGAHFMLCAAYGLLYKSHVSIDLFTSHTNKKVQEILGIVSYAFMFFPFMIVFLIWGIDFTVTAWKMGETSWSVWGPSLVPIKAVIPVTAALVLLQGIAEVIKKILYLRKGVAL
ncbi:MAG: Tripartite ATP-independent periplasmic transporter [Smithella sp. PtaU1.Bin162]|jgi:TRAP-type mannitol/chloroaromatic compound transport system permease small subunit|nr:MAG: Tripartite ATP-independent periplasmic transporter [Smithella sp. PtaU1.Bin162]